MEKMSLLVVVVQVDLVLIIFSTNFWGTFKSFIVLSFYLNKIKELKTKRSSKSIIIFFVNIIIAQIKLKVSRAVFDLNS